MPRYSRLHLSLLSFKSLLELVHPASSLRKKRRSKRVVDQGGVSSSLPTSRTSDRGIAPISDTSYLRDGIMTTSPPATCRSKSSSTWENLSVSRSILPDIHCKY